MKIEVKVGKNRAHNYYCDGKRVSYTLAADLLKHDARCELAEILHRESNVSSADNATVMVVIDIMRDVPQRGSNFVGGIGFSLSVAVSSVGEAVRVMQCAKDKMTGFEKATAYDYDAWLDRAATPLIPLAFIYEHWANARRTVTQQD